VVGDSLTLPGLLQTREEVMMFLKLGKGSLEQLGRHQHQPHKKKKKRKEERKKKRRVSPNTNTTKLKHSYLNRAIAWNGTLLNFRRFFPRSVVKEGGLRDSSATFAKNNSHPLSFLRPSSFFFFFHDGG